MTLPAPSPLDRDAVESLRAWLRAHRRIFVLTGAGISTNSGIPDYRGPDGRWKRKAPVSYQDFVRDPLTRARYWARSLVGWPLVARATPNRGHAALVVLEAQDRLATLVTQNVDGLHTRAGQRTVIDLHGRIDAVVCLDCGAQTPRASVQARLVADNPQWQAVSAAAAPDGDADLDDLDASRFLTPHCPCCDGMLKPDVVFFGENVPRDRVGSAVVALQAADAMLVVGSSLMVYSGFRFARMAREMGLPLALLTHGVSRADDLATLGIDADCETTLAGAVVT